MQGINFLLHNNAVLLADEMGLGKTVQVAVALEILFHQKKSLRSLIVVPASLKYNWENELNIWAPSLSVCKISGKSYNRWAAFRSPFHVVIASYNDVRIEYSNKPPRAQYDIVILDEAQKIKNPISSTSRTCKLIEREKSWVLTGTPIENKKDDLVAIFNFINYGFINSNMRKKQIHNKIKQHFVRRKKEEVLSDMPPIIEQEIILELIGDQKHSYDNYYNYSISALRANNNDGNILKYITKLKQICNYDKDSNESVKMKTLLPIIEETKSNGKKILIFSQYVDTLKWIFKQLENYNCDIFHGGLSAEQRNDIVNNFENTNNLDILLISLQAGGVGLNLQSAEIVVLFDRWWNPAIEKQAISRAHRFGRKSPLHVIKLLVRNSIEDKINEIIQNKNDLFDKYVEEAESSDSIRFITELKKVLKIN